MVEPTATHYYGVFDPEGVPKGFYPDDVFLPKEDGTRNDAIPTVAVEITEAAWQALLAGQPLTRYVNGQVITVAPPPPPPDPVNPTLVEAQRANARLDAGVVAALDVAVAVKVAMQNIPDTFSNANWVASKIQLDALTEAMVAMLQGQAALPPVIKPPAVKPP